MAHFKVGCSLAAPVTLVSHRDLWWPTEYVSTLPQLLWNKPASLPYDDAAPMGGIALSTAAQVSYRLSLKIE